jgi:tetratricopeptide (TPR) repeat protein
MRHLRLPLAGLLIALCGAPLAAAPSDQAKAETQAPAQPAGRQKILDELFDRLAKAQDELEAKGIEGAIERVWMRSGSDTADLLMGRAMQAMTRKDYKLSLEVFDALIDLEPDWAEAWHKRALVRFHADDERGAMADLMQALAREPKHLGALTGIGSLMHREGFDKGALVVLRRALEISPQQETVRKLVEKLALEVEGREI